MKKEVFDLIYEEVISLQKGKLEISFQLIFHYKFSNFYTQTNLRKFLLL